MKKKVLLWVSVIVFLAASPFIGDFAYKYGIHLRHRLQEKFADIHAALNGGEEDQPFADNGISQDQITARDSVTTEIEVPANAIKWDVLSKADTKPDKDNVFRPVFTKDIQQLDKQTVIAKGYMFPLDAFGKQTHFLLSPYPPSCPFCLPAGPNELIEIKPVDAMKFTYDPVTVKGKFELLQSEEDVKQGMFYRMENAEQQN